LRHSIAATRPDHIIHLGDIYPSGTTPIPGVTGKLVVNAVLDAHPTTRLAWMPRRTDLHKIMLMVRTPRGGKGAIGHDPSPNIFVLRHR